MTAGRGNSPAPGRRRGHGHGGARRGCGRKSGWTPARLRKLYELRVVERWGYDRIAMHFGLSPGSIGRAVKTLLPGVIATIAAETGGEAPPPRAPAAGERDRTYRADPDLMRRLAAAVAPLAATRASDEEIGALMGLAAATVASARQQAAGAGRATERHDARGGLSA